MEGGEARPHGGHFTAPVNTIPVEIVKEIFKFVVSHDFRPEENFNIFDPYDLSQDELNRGPHLPTYASCASPFALSHVSRHWRTISLESPVIWTSLRVIWPTAKRIELIKAWLTRGRPMLLSLSLFQGANTENVDASEATLSLFLEHIGRWRFIELTVHEQVNLLLSDDSAAMMCIPEALQTVKIMVDRHDRSQRSKFYRLLHSSPNLRTAVWDNTQARIQMNGMILPSIVNLPLDVIYSYDDLRDALLKCKKLERLVINRLCYTDDASAPSLELTNLRYLKLDDSVATSSLLWHLRLPHLEELHLGGGYGPDQGLSLWPPVRSMLQSSACSLRVLSIAHLYDRRYAEQLISTLRLPSFENLARLEFHSGYTSSVIDFSTVTPQENIKHTISTSRSSIKTTVSNAQNNCGWKGKNVDIVCAVKLAFSYEEEEALADQEHVH